MSDLFAINVSNAQSVRSSFFLFQQPALFGKTAGTPNSLYCGTVLPAEDGAQLALRLDATAYAMVVEIDPPAPISHMAPSPGVIGVHQVASQQIDLAAPSDSPALAQSTTMIWDSTGRSLGLAKPSHQQGVPAGAFRIQTATFAPPDAFQVGAGAVVNGAKVLSSFIGAKPQLTVDCAPVQKYYIAAGSETFGTPLNFAQASKNAQLCDFTSGHHTADVTYNTDGSWSVTMS